MDVNDKIEMKKSEIVYDNWDTNKTTPFLKSSDENGNISMQVVETLDLGQTGEIDAENLNYDAIATDEFSAVNGDYVNVSEKAQQWWGDDSNGKINYVINDDGSVKLIEVKDDGSKTVLGFTTKEELINSLNSSNTKIVEESSNSNKFTDEDLERRDEALKQHRAMQEIDTKVSLESSNDNETPQTDSNNNLIDFLTPGTATELSPGGLGEAPVAVFDNPIDSLKTGAIAAGIAAGITGAAVGISELLTGAEIAVAESGTATAGLSVAEGGTATAGLSVAEGGTATAGLSVAEGGTATAGLSVAEGGTATAGLSVTEEATTGTSTIKTVKELYTQAVTKAQNLMTEYMKSGDNQLLREIQKLIHPDLWQSYLETGEITTEEFNALGELLGIIQGLK